MFGSFAYLSAGRKNSRSELQMIRKKLIAVCFDLQRYAAIRRLTLRYIFCLCFYIFHQTHGGGGREGRGRCSADGSVAFVYVQISCETDYVPYTRLRCESTRHLNSFTYLRHAENLPLTLGKLCAPPAPGTSDRLFRSPIPEGLRGSVFLISTP